MEKLFIITGANGHLGTALIRQLEESSCEIRGLILPGEEAVPAKETTSYFHGDVRDPASLAPLFENIEGKEVYLIHTAGIIDISEHVSKNVYEVNVNGTKNILRLCKEQNIHRLVYVSSVHAIPEKDKASVLSEVGHFSPKTVHGGYAKTKAMATQLVLDAVKNDGLDAVIVHPSGILGPYSGQANHLVQLVCNYIQGVLPACVKGGYDFVDVRDVANGCLLAAEKGRTGECYILSNRHYEIKELLRMVRTEAGGRRLPVLPMWMAKMATPCIELDAKRKKRRPLFTKYSLSTLESNDRFSHDKATSELGYRPRDLVKTIRDTVSWYKYHKLAV